MNFLMNGLNNLKRNKMITIIASIIIAWPLWMIASEINQLNKK